MKMTLSLAAFSAAGLLTAFALTGTAAPASSPIGRWTQSSSGLELVLAPKFKLQPNYGLSTGTNLGGSVGQYSATRTTIVTEPVPMQVTRSMSLDIQPNGQFSWSIEKRHPETPNGTCLKTTRTRKTGQVQHSAARILFKVTGGTESWSKSCGGEGSAALAGSSETYAVTLEPTQMHLVDGPVNWVFRRAG